MEILDKKINKKVAVSDEKCLKRACYWPRPDPGVFTQGQGYRQRSHKVGWLCGTREVHGCPMPKPKVIIHKGGIDRDADLVLSEAARRLRK